MGKGDIILQLKGRFGSQGYVVYWLKYLSLVCTGRGERTSYGVDFHAI
jgi:hypothetical protein